MGAFFFVKLKFSISRENNLKINKLFLYKPKNPFPTYERWFKSPGRTGLCLTWALKFCKSVSCCFNFSFMQEGVKTEKKNIYFYITL